MRLLVICDFEAGLLDRILAVYDHFIDRPDITLLRSARTNEALSISGVTRIIRIPFRVDRRAPRVGILIALEMFVRASLYLTTVVFLLPIITWSCTFDLIHAQYLLPQGLAGVLISRITGKPLVLTATGTDVNLLSKNRLARVLMRGILFQKSMQIIAVSNALYKQLEELGCRRITYIPNYVATREDVSTSCDTSMHNILFVGTLEKVKNLEVLIQAFRVVAGRIQDARLMIAGMGPMKRSLESLTASLCLKDRVQFVGYLEREALSKAYRESQIFVLPSLSEGLSVSLLEAMSFGKGIVVSEAANPSVIQNGIDGLTFHTGDADDLAGKMLWLFRNPAKLAQIGANARTRCRVEYSLQAVAPRLEKIYSEASLDGTKGTHSKIRLGLDT